MRKLNQYGWGLNELLAGIGVFAFCFILVTILYQSKFKNLTRTVEKNFPTPSYTYIDMEKEMKEAAIHYIEKEYGNDLPDGAIKITIQDLKNQNLYAKVKDPKSSRIDCDGYVLVTQKKHAYSYHPYLKCGDNYTTKGYNKAS